MSKRTWLLASIVAVAFFAATLTLAHAQTDDPGDLNLTTSPLPISLVAAPGETATTELRVKNSGRNTERLKVQLMKFTAFGEEGRPRLADREPGDDYFDWVSFSETEFNVDPNVWHTIDMTIDLPETAAFGYYYAVVFSRADPSVEVEDREAAVVGGTATLVLLEAAVPGAERSVALTEFNVDRRIHEFLPATFEARLANRGNIHVAPTGSIFISRGDSHEATIGVNTAGGNILPDSGRIFSASWDDGFPVYQPVMEDDQMVLDENGEVTQRLTWNLNEASKLRWGRYTATILMVYDDGTRDVPLEATVDFWVVPWRLIVMAIAIPLLPALLVYIWMRKKTKKAGKS